MLQLQLTQTINPKIPEALKSDIEPHNSAVKKKTPDYHAMWLYKRLHKAEREKDQRKIDLCKNKIREWFMIKRTTNPEVLKYLLRKQYKKSKKGRRNNASLKKIEAREKWQGLTSGQKWARPNI